MSPIVGRLVLTVSGLGFPLTQFAIRHLGKPGAVVVAATSAGLLVRDVAMIATGTPSRLRRGPAILLWLEAAAAVAATVTCLPPVLDAGVRDRARQARADGFEAVRRAAVGTLFGLHTMRFRIYLQPDHGRRPAAR